MQALIGTKTEKYEWLSSGDKNTNELLPVSFQEIGKSVQIETDTGSFHFKIGTIKFLSPLIISEFFWQNSAEDKLEILIVKSISQITEVEYILFFKEDNYYEIWTVINKLDREVRDRIYDVEYNILERFRDNYFDFHVICRDEKSIEEICPTNAIIFYRRKT